MDIRLLSSIRTIRPFLSSIRPIRPFFIQYPAGYLLQLGRIPDIFNYVNEINKAPLKVK
jgi:hypothetical protein